MGSWSPRGIHRCLSACRTLALALVAANLLISTCTHAAESDDPDEEVLVRRVVPRDYREQSARTEKLSTILANSLQRPITVKPGATLSGILHDEFSVSPSWTPRVYEKFAEHVRQTNGLKDPSKDLRTGEVLLVPDMPRGAETLRVGRVRAPTQARITFGAVRNLRIVGAPKPINEVTKVTPTEVQIRSMKRSEYAALEVDPQATRNELEARAQFVPLQGAMEVRLATGAAQNNELAETEKTGLSMVLQRPAQTQPYVVVLDDSWPSQEDFRRSAQFVIQASRLIRSAYSLQDGDHKDSPDISILEAEMKYGTSFCDSDCEFPTLKWHSAMVRKSLEDLRGLDKNGLIDVIYLPLNRAQRYSRNVLTEMLRVTLLADSVTSQLVLTTPAGRMPSDVDAGIPNYADVEQMVRTIMAPARLGTVPAPYTAGAELRVSTDKAIVDAVVNFMVLYSAASRRPHFISMSWTTPQNALPALFRSDAYGLWIAAAGNDPGVNVHSKGAQFAARSSMPGDFVAVQNTASAGCDTSKLSENPVLRIYGIAYPGRIDGTHCGTSFSAPRVAWLLAAREAVKGKSVMPAQEESWMQWKAMRMESLFKLTKPAAAGEERYRVSIWQLLEEPAP